MKDLIDTNFFEFFIGLALNNRKSWFDENRSRYEQHVKKPFTALVEALQEALGPPYSGQKPGDFMFRINRDIRFSKNKEPYKLHMAAAFSPQGKKDMMHPGFYIQLGVEQCAVYMGIYNPDSTTVDRIRKHLAANLDELDTLLQAKWFRQYFGSVQGETQKRMPAALAAVAHREPVIAQKQWYYAYEFEPEEILNKDQVSFIMKAYHAGKPMNEFLMRAWN